MSYLSLCCDGPGRHCTRTSTRLLRAPIAETFKQARRSVGVSCEPAKLDSQDNSPCQGKDKPPATAADSVEHTRPTIMS